MANINVNAITRENIRAMKAYSSARDEFQGEASCFMDANENPYNSPLNRYPDPHQRILKKEISRLYNIDDSGIFLGNGSDEAIDLLFRAFCIPGKSNVISMDPSYGMYEVCAAINDIEFRKVLLRNDFSLDADAILAAADENSRLVFLCSPNNPSSNLLDKNSILKIVRNFKGIVVLDEAYIDFSGFEGMLPEVKNNNNLVVLRTFSKAWGMAGVRLGMAFADKEIIEILTRIKYPYNVNQLSQDIMLEHIKKNGLKNKWVEEIVKARKFLEKELLKIDTVLEVYPSDANFLLVKTKDPKRIYNFLKDKGIIVRDRSAVSLSEGCLRITVGTESENDTLLKALIQYDNL